MRIKSVARIALPIALAGMALIACLGLLRGTVQGAPAFSGTEVSGYVLTDTVWSLSNSPYLVIEELTVSPGVTLTVEPGVEIRFEANKKLVVYGTLLAQGTPTQPITFTRNGTEKWFSLMVQNNGRGIVTHLSLALRERG